MKFKKILCLTLILVSFSSCVSKKLYTELEDNYADLKKSFNALDDEHNALKQSSNKNFNELQLAQRELTDLRAESQRLQNELLASQNKVKQLQAAYDALEKNSSSSLEANMKKNRELLAELELKEKSLNAEKERLDALQAVLKNRSQRIEELEQMISKNDQQLKSLRETLSRALNSFEGKGLTVEQKNGKVYVSMENKLLFASGSWTVNQEGRNAIEEVGKVLAENQDISVLIEGHTDNVPYVGSNVVKNNWELSTKRALAVVEILERNPKIIKENLTAAGRGEFAPLMSNDTPEGKAKNRRIEIILTPKLDEISQLLKEM